MANEDDSQSEDEESQGPLIDPLSSDGSEGEDESRQQSNAELRRQNKLAGEEREDQQRQRAEQAVSQNQQAALEKQIRAVESAVGSFEAAFNNFTIVGGDGVEVHGNLRTGFSINKR